jgi:hypothetical protein
MELILFMTAVVVLCWIILTAPAQHPVKDEIVRTVLLWESSKNQKEEMKYKAELIRLVGLLKRDEILVIIKGEPDGNA